MTKHRVLLVVMAASLLVSACASTTATPSPTAPTSTTSISATSAPSEGATPAPSAPPQVTIRLGEQVSADGNSQQWIGITHGYWAKLGINFTETVFDSGPPEFQAEVGGSLDIGQAGGASTLFSCQGVVEPLIWNAIEPGGGALFAQSGITSIKDLKGKTVATTEGSIAEVFLYLALQANGMSLKDVNEVNMDMPTAVQAFIGKSVDAIADFEEYTVAIQQARPDAVLLTTAAKYPAVKSMNGWMVTPQWLQNNHDVAVRVVLGWLEANDYLWNNQTAAQPEIFNAGFVPRHVSQDAFNSGWASAQFLSNADWKALVDSGGVDTIQTNTANNYIALGKIKSCSPPESQWNAGYKAIFSEAYALWQKTQTHG
jgi:NitT/TauT family transport system substrate-binding protein